MLALYSAVGANGEKDVTAALPLGVMVAAFVLLSKNLLLWHVSSDVPEIAVSGITLGVIELPV